MCVCWGETVVFVLPQYFLIITSNILFFVATTETVKMSKKFVICWRLIPVRYYGNLVHACYMHGGLVFVQVENIQSRVQMMREMIDRSESVILINLDSQRNIMLRLSLQLEMGAFSAALAGLIGMAFGMNLTSSLEEVSV